MAKIVGKGVPEKEARFSDDDNLRCQGGRSLRNGNSDCEPPLDDVAILQAHARTVQAPLRGKSLPFRSGQQSSWTKDKSLGIRTGGYSCDRLSTLSLPRFGTTVLIPRTPLSRSHREKESSGSGKKICWMSSRKKVRRSPLFSSAASRSIRDNGSP